MPGVKEQKFSLLLNFLLLRKSGNKINEINPLIDANFKFLKDDSEVDP